MVFNDYVMLSRLAIQIQYYIQNKIMAIHVSSKHCEKLNTYSFATQIEAAIKLEAINRLILALNQNRTITELDLECNKVDVGREAKIESEVNQILERNRKIQEEQCKMSFVMGLHPRAGRESSLNQTASSPIFDRQLLSLLFQFSGHQQAKEKTLNKQNEMQPRNKSTHT